MTNEEGDRRRAVELLLGKFAPRDDLFVLRPLLAVRLWLLRVRKDYLEIVYVVVAPI